MIKSIESAMDRSHGNFELLCDCPIGESFITQTSDLFGVKWDSGTSELLAVLLGLAEASNHSLSDDRPLELGHGT